MNHYYTKCFLLEWIRLKVFVTVVIAVTFVREMIEKCRVVGFIATFSRGIRTQEGGKWNFEVLKRVGEKRNVKYLQLLTESRSGLLLMELNWYLYYSFFLSRFFINTSVKLFLLLMFSSTSLKVFFFHFSPLIYSRTLHVHIPMFWWPTKNVTKKKSHLWKIPSFVYCFN